MTNHTMYYNSSLVYFNHKTANSYYNSFNFIVNNNNNPNANSNNGGGPATSNSLATIANSHYLNGSSSLTNGHQMDESLTNSSNGNGNNTFNINSLLANGDLLDGKRRAQVEAPVEEKREERLVRANLNAATISNAKLVIAQRKLVVVVVSNATTTK